MGQRISSPAELKALREKTRAEIDLRSGPKDVRVTVHMGTCGIAAGAREILAALMDGLSRAEAPNVTLHQAGCLGLCDQEPVMTVTDASGREVVYGRLDEQRVREIVERHLVGGQPVAEYVVRA